MARSEISWCARAVFCDANVSHRCRAVAPSAPRRPVRAPLALASLCLLLAVPVWAGSVLTLSEFSSDETNAAILNAAFDFELAGHTLTLSVTNTTTNPSSFDISAVYFNLSPRVDGLLLTSGPTGWSLSDGEHAAGFGRFDVALLSELGNDAFEIAPGLSADFMFEILASAPADLSDFTTELSRIPPGDQPAAIAAKFINGPGDDSAFGATVPEPSTAALVVVGIAAVFRRRASRGQA